MMGWNFRSKGRILTTIDIANHIDSAAIEGNEAERKEHSHGKSGRVGGTCELGDHRGLQAHRQHAPSQSGHYSVSTKIRFSRSSGHTIVRRHNELADLRRRGFRPTLSSRSAPTKLEIVATVTYAAPKINGTPPVSPRFWYRAMMYTGSRKMSISSRSGDFRRLTYRR